MFTSRWKEEFIHGDEIEFAFASPASCAIIVHCASFIRGFVTNEKFTKELRHFLVIRIV